jgi:hypothetical protein
VQATLCDIEILRRLPALGFLVATGGAAGAAQDERWQALVPVAPAAPPLPAKSGTPTSRPGPRPIPRTGRPALNDHSCICKLLLTRNLIPSYHPHSETWIVWMAISGRAGDRLQSRRCAVTHHFAPPGSSWFPQTDQRFRSHTRKKRLPSPALPPDVSELGPRRCGCFPGMEAICWKDWQCWC